VVQVSVAFSLELNCVHFKLATPLCHVRYTGALAAHCIAVVVVLRLAVVCGIVQSHTSPNRRNVGFDTNLVAAIELK
jgi:hypothetical protein